MGLGFVDILAFFEEDPDTVAVVLIGEIGGQAEEAAVRYFRDHMSKPVIAFIAGVTAPAGRRMGHAGAIISGGVGTAQEKIDLLEKGGITVVRSPAEIGDTTARVLAARAAL